MLMMLVILLIPTCLTASVPQYTLESSGTAYVLSDSDVIVIANILKEYDYIRELNATLVAEANAAELYINTLETKVNSYELQIQALLAETNAASNTIYSMQLYISELELTVSDLKVELNKPDFWQALMYTTLGYTISNVVERLGD